MIQSSPFHERAGVPHKVAKVYFLSEEYLEMSDHLIHHRVNKTEFPRGRFETYLTLEGMPNRSTAVRKLSKTVVALLLEDVFRYTIRRENPSIPP